MGCAPASRREHTFIWQTRICAKGAVFSFLKTEPDAQNELRRGGIPLTRRKPPRNTRCRFTPPSRPGFLIDCHWQSLRIPFDSRINKHQNTPSQMMRCFDVQKLLILREPILPARQSSKSDGGSRIPDCSRRGGRGVWGEFRPAALGPLSRTPGGFRLSRKREAPQRGGNTLNWGTLY
jgi:hypothetical protein